MGLEDADQDLFVFSTFRPQMPTRQLGQGIEVSLAARLQPDEALR